MNSLKYGGFVARIFLLATIGLAAWGCDDDDGGSAVDAARDSSSPGDARDGGAEAGSEAGDSASGDAPAAETSADGAGDSALDGASDGSGDAPMLTEAQARGRYLVQAVLACADCHTPRLPSGAPQPGKELSGVSCLFDVAPGAAGGCISSPNLTNHETGLKNVTDDAAIKDMIVNGRRPDGKYLHGVMPYYELHNLSASDADAIVAYLRTVTPVDNRPADNEPPFVERPTAPVAFVDPAQVPAVGTTTDVPSATRGRYLSMLACLGCHTPEKSNPAPTELPLDATRYFAGARAFPATLLGVPSPPFPEIIYTQNLTQHATGLLGWTADDVIKALKEGKDRMDKGLCPPMPSGMAAFGHLTDSDARDIANYVVSLPGVANALPNQCEAPPAP